MKWNILTVLFCLSILFIGQVHCSPPASTQDGVTEPIQDSVSSDTAVENTTPEPDANTQEATPPESSQPEHQEATPNETLPENGTPEASSWSIEKICQFTAEISCRPIFTCCKGRSLKYPDAASCIKDVQKACVTTANQKEGKALAAGHIYIDPSSIAACRSAAEEAGKKCTILTRSKRDITCGTIFKDKAEPGENCKSELGGLQCAKGKGICFPTPVGTPCKAWGQPGELCSKAPCRPGTFCIIPKDPKAQATCELPRSKGGFCRITVHCQKGLACIKGSCSTRSSEGQSCQGVGHCHDGLVCDPTTAKCIKPAKADEACRFIYHCAEGLACHGGTTALVCQQSRKENESCVDSRDCSKGLRCLAKVCKPLPKKGESCKKQEGCQSGWVCDSQQTCVALPKDGEACLKGQTPCADGLACFSSVCKAKKKAGETCTSDEQCLQGLGCGSSGKCIALPDAGKACHKGFLCKAGLYCDITKSKTCKNKLPKDAPCPVGFECQDGLSCIAPDGKNKKCLPTPSLGEKCSRECTGDLVCRPGIVTGKCIQAICIAALSK